MNESEKRHHPGDAPATPEQEDYLDTLSHELGDDRPKNMTKEGADEEIAELRHKVAELEGGRETTERPAQSTPISPNANR